MSKSFEQKTVPLASIQVPADMNVRHDLPAIKTLAKSIQDRGLLQPVAVTNGGDGYTLIAGYRRMKAIESLGWKEVPVIVQTYAKASGSLERLIDNILENSQREDVHPLDLAERAHQLVEGTYPVLDGEKATPQDRKHVAKLLGWGASHLNNLIRVFVQLDPDVARLARKEQVPVRKLLEWVALPFKTGDDPGKNDENRFKVQHAAFEAWKKAKEALESEGRTKAARGSKGKGDGEGEGGGSSADSSTMVNKARTAYLQNCIIILKEKAEAAQAEGDNEQALLFTGRAESLRFVTGDLSRLPGVTKADLAALERALAADEESDEEEEQTEEE
jgi:ParB/RepB/Spo0J family partition protein